MRPLCPETTTAGGGTSGCPQRIQCSGPGAAGRAGCGWPRTAVTGAAATTPTAPRTPSAGRSGAAAGRAKCRDCLYITLVHRGGEATTTTLRLGRDCCDVTLGWGHKAAGRRLRRAVMPGYAAWKYELVNYKKSSRGTGRSGTGGRLRGDGISWRDAVRRRGELPLHAGRVATICR